MDRQNQQHQGKDVQKIRDLENTIHGIKPEQYTSGRGSGELEMDLREQSSMHAYQAV